MAIAYCVAGINHFVNPDFYRKIMPPWLPWHDTLILVSGALETLLGISLIPFFTRRIAAWGLIILLIAVFPANIQMMLDYQHQHNPKLWLTILRLPLQLVLIWWAWLFTVKNKTFIKQPTYRNN